MTTIYLTRHGKTLWNLEKRLQGFGDSELTEEGINQAIELRDRLEDVHIDSIYTSPIKRAYKTARIIQGNKDVKFVVEDGLKEINFGEYEGSTEEELLKIGKGYEISKIFSGEMDVRAPGGESLRELCRRVKLVLDNILEYEKDKTILIVTHGTTLKAIVGYFRHDNGLYEEIMGQATLTKIVCEDNDFKFEYINDGSHLKSNVNKSGW